MDKQELAQEIMRLRTRMEQSAMDDSAKEREILRFAGENMDASQKDKLQNVLRDRQALQELLRSESAQALLQRLRGGQ